MNLKMLSNILEELESHKGKSKSEIMMQCVQDRLNKSLAVYYQEVSNSFIYLYDKKDINVLKKMNKY